VSLAQDIAQGDAGTSAAGTLRPGDEVVVSKRFTWHIPIDGNADFRKDIAVGTLGRVVGYADAEHRQLLLRVPSLALPSHRGTVRRDITDKAYPYNLELKADFDKRPRNLRPRSLATRRLPKPPPLG